MEGKDVVVLEGRDRIGGRIYTEIHDGVAYDLGGSWIHGGTEGLSVSGVSGVLTNPIYNLTRTNGINFVWTYNKTIDDGIDWDSYGKLGYERFFYSNGEKITIAENEWAYYDTERKALEDERNAMLEDTMLREDAKKLEKVLNHYEGANAEFINPALYLHLTEWIYEQEAIGDIEELSSEHIILGQYFYGLEDDDGIFPEGYTQIANCLADDLKILHANVTKIDHSGNQVVVTTSNNETFSATHVVSTIPLGVLQKNRDLFFPSFTPDKINALDNLGMGTMDKVYLIFDDETGAFWDSEEYEPGEYNAYIHRVTSANDEYPDTWKFYLNLNTYTKKPALLAFHTGSIAKSMDDDEKTDDDLKTEAVQVLEKMFPDSKPIPEPEIVRTQWAEDSLSWGSYSFVKHSGSAKDFDVMAKPIDDQVFFAGEATTRCSFGTVHGAYTSGYRAAQEILDLEDKADSIEEQLRHGVERWELVDEKTPTEDDIPKRCGGNGS